jgi:hypothetical protein
MTGGRRDQYLRLEARLASVARSANRSGEILNTALNAACLGMREHTLMD